jgi:hypothetical protein
MSFMNSSRNEPCPVCTAKYPHKCGINVIPMMVCTICNSPAYIADDGFFRHANDGFEDGSTFCDKYGYPIKVKQP